MTTFGVSFTYESYSVDVRLANIIGLLLLMDRVR